MHEIQSINGANFPLLRQAVKSSPVIVLSAPDRPSYGFNVLPFGERGTRLAPALVREVIRGLQASVRDIGKEFDFFVAPEPGGHTWGQLLSFVLNKELVILRSSPTELPGEIRAPRRTGYYDHCLYFNHLRNGDQIMLVDDVISTGGSIRVILQQLRGLNIKVAGVVAIYSKASEHLNLEREFNIPVRVLLSRAELDY